MKTKEEKLATRREWYRKNADKEIARTGKVTKARRIKIKAWINDVKAKEGCCKCPENDPICLDFHHIGDDKEAAISTKITNWGKEKLQKEMNKCIIICSNCHRKLHAGLIINKKLILV